PQVTLHITPTNLSFGSIAIGQQSTLVVTVANLGTQSLNWDATAGNTSWLTLSTTTGTITAGGLPQTINVTADTTNLAPQSYTTALQINSNGGRATVAVTLVVTTVTQTP